MSRRYIGGGRSPTTPWQREYAGGRRGDGPVNGSLSGLRTSGERLGSCVPSSEILAGIEQGVPQAADLPPVYDELPRTPWETFTSATRATARFEGVLAAVTCPCGFQDHLLRGAGILGQGVPLGARGPSDEPKSSKTARRRGKKSPIRLTTHCRFAKLLA
jgi:hypothetical protein